MKKIFLSIVITSFVILTLCHVIQAQKPIQTSNKIVLIVTQYGDIKIKLYNETPLHRDNFIKLVKEKYLDSTLFHRVINQFMIQGGDPDSKHATAGSLLGNGGPTYTIPAEFVNTLFHKKGALAAAREGDQVNPTKASSGSQFYIVQGKVFTAEELNMFAQRMGKTFSPEQIKAYTTIGGTPHLDNNYTVFGEVIDGLNVIDKIAAVTTDKNNRPLNDIPMTVTIIEE
ncbi:MAG: peptidylprolyl isomerase [Bacteroidetes bacterium]|nr:peptidylprolyl isomerase [Bacteroidota bacterium]